MLNVYLIDKEKLGDRNFDEIPVSELQLEVEPISLEEFQKKFNAAQVDPRTQFMKVVSV